MRRVALLAFLLFAGCSGDVEHASGMVKRDFQGVSVTGDNRAEWTAHFIGDTLKKINERSKQGDYGSAKNVYWFDKGSLRLFDSQRDTITMHVLFDAAGRVTKFSKREDGRAVAVEPAEAQEALRRAAFLAGEARRAAGVSPAPH